MIIMDVIDRKLDEINDEPDPEKKAELLEALKEYYREQTEAVVTA